MPPEPRGADRFDDWLAAQGWKSLGGHARNLLTGVVAENWPGRAEDFVHGMLRWAVSDEPEARVQWAVLGDRSGTDAPRRSRRRGELPDPADRDAYVEALWESLQRAREHNGFREWMRGWRLQEVYQRFLAQWFLARFDLARAQRVGAPGGAVVGPLLAVGLAAAALPGLALGWFGVRYAASVIAGAGIALVLVLALAACRARGAPLALVVDLLLPRLGAGVAVGYLALAVAPELVAYLASRTTAGAIGAALAVLGAAWVHGTLHVRHRVHPDPGFRVASRRAGALLLAGAGWAAVGLAAFAPLLLAPDFLAGLAMAPEVGSGPPHLFLLASVALALGVGLELAWEEKPLTAPL